MGGPKSKPVACRKHKTLRGCGNLTFDKLRDLKPIWIAMTGRPPGPDDCAVNLHAIGWSPLGGRHQKKGCRRGRTALWFKVAVKFE